MQSARTITLEYVFFELLPFEVCNWQFCDKIMSALYKPDFLYKTASLQ